MVCLYILCGSPCPVHLPQSLPMLTDFTPSNVPSTFMPWILDYSLYFSTSKPIFLLSRSLLEVHQRFAYETEHSSICISEFKLCRYHYFLIHSHSYNFYNFILPESWMHFTVNVCHIFYPLLCWWTEVSCVVFKVSKDTIQQKPKNLKVGLLEYHLIILHSRRACLKMCFRIFLVYTYRSLLKIICLQSSLMVDNHNFGTYIAVKNLK